MPQSDDEQRMSKGYAFVEFNTSQVSNLLLTFNAREGCTRPSSILNSAAE